MSFSSVSALLNTAAKPAPVPKVIAKAAAPAKEAKSSSEDSSDDSDSEEEEKQQPAQVCFSFLSFPKHVLQR